MRILGMGDNVVDRYINKRIMFPGGNAVNFAVYAAQCGEESAYLGNIADDIEGKLVYDSLITLGIDVSKSPLKEGLVTERCDVRLDDGDRVFVGCEYGDRGQEAWIPFTIEEGYIDYLKRFDVIHCGCYASMENEMSKLKDINAIKTYDFSAEDEYRTDEYLEKVCPYIDIALFSAAEMSEEVVENIVKKVLLHGTRIVLVTDGVNGQKLWYNGEMYNGMVKKVTPVDTMGAGDSFFTAFVIAIMRHGFGDGRELVENDIKEVFEYAANFSAETCLVEGAFGFATKY
ncbi:MAG: PfkB family carbohydrate kinase [Parabacteroides sp.]|nr:PfkB family carbohydrate kinase [Parabacteroides sp.]